MLKANLKIVWAENAVILSKIIFWSAKIHMHIFNLSKTSMHGFKMTHLKNCKKSWLHKLHTLQCKKLPKMTYNA